MKKPLSKDRRMKRHLHREEDTGGYIKQHSPWVFTIYIATQESTYVDGHVSERLQLKVTVQRLGIVDTFLGML